MVTISRSLLDRVARLITWFFCFVCPIAIAVESDPPELLSFSLNPSAVDVSVGPVEVIFTVEASDESDIDWTSSKLEFNSPSGAAYYLEFSAEAPHLASFVLSCNDPEGTWSVGYVRLLDELGNRKNYYSGELPQESPSLVEVFSTDGDQDGIEGCLDPDDDNDGVLDEQDSFPFDRAETIDTDGDGVGNNADLDDDNDGFSDEQEAVDGTNPLSRFSCKSGCFSFDIDENKEAKALSDGLLVIRHLFGFSGNSLTSGATTAEGARTSAEAISSYLSDADSELDIDGDGQSKALTDGLLLIRYLFGFSGDSLTAGAIGEGAERSAAGDIEKYISDRLPSE